MKNLVKDFNSFPRQIKYIVGNEACERFSFYGMRSILIIFMINQLKITEENSETIYHLFVSAAYLLPLLGAYLSDRYLGKYKTILYLSLIYCLGHVFLSIWENEFGLFLGLALISIGSGGIKPCVSAYVGDQFTEKNKDLLQKVFNLFYWSINFGSFFSTLLIPVVLLKWGSQVAFAIPGVLMGIATLIFWMGRKDYIDIPPSRSSSSDGKTAGFMSIFIAAIRNIKKKKKGQEFFDLALTQYSVEEVEGAKAVFGIIKVFITVSIFWALYDQDASSWVLQAQKMDPNFAGFHIEPAQVQALNPIMILVLIPIFGSFIYPAVEKMGIRVTPLRKMSVGMVLAAFSFVTVGFMQTLIDSGHHLSVAWQIIPYTILTCSEVMVSVTGLEFAYTQAPRTMKSTIMSFWLVTVFIGNLLDAYVAKINVFQGAMFFYFFAALMFLVSIIFVISAARYKVRNYVETEPARLATAEA